MFRCLLDVFINFHSIFRFHQTSLFFVFVLVVKASRVDDLALLRNVGVWNLSAQVILILFNNVTNLCHVETVRVLGKSGPVRHDFILGVSAGSTKRHISHIFPVHAQRDKHRWCKLELEFVG